MYVHRLVGEWLFVAGKIFRINYNNLLIKIQSVRMTLMVAAPRPPSVFCSFVLSVSSLDAWYILLSSWISADQSAKHYLLYPCVLIVLFTTVAPPTILSSPSYSTFSLFQYLLCLFVFEQISVLHHSILIESQVKTTDYLAKHIRYYSGTLFN